MPRAIITGATGINGTAILQALSADPTTWTEIHAVSRSLPSSPPSSRIKHTPLDLLTPPSEISTHLQSKLTPSSSNEDIPRVALIQVNTVYVFFTAYMEKPTEEEMADVDGRMLRNFIEGLREAGLEGCLKRVVLTTGAKYYGVQHGPIKLPAEETDPRVDDPTCPPNFYYVQEDILRDEARDRNWDWVICVPNDIIGYAHGNYMNIASALAIYATVCHELSEPLFFPGNETFYTGWDSHSYSKLIAEFEIWAALTPQTSNQLLNIVNDDPATWATNWPRLATYFNTRIPPDQFSRAAPLPSSTKLPLAPPIEAYADTAGLAGRIPRSTLENRVDLVKWSQRQEVKDAWEKIVDRSGGKIRSDGLEKATWRFANFVLGRQYSIVISMAKGRELGWKGWGSTWGGV
ncbi:NAD(P)-binding protein [Choiromyces venosus 120613-1]|uniref:NAD(P)-binding protein n=1 Tax=Choiromyces venosus 120613-1 TaxID=1336337 RepID=A0A3N4JPN2_9PEZI|nr:NAD(P)-binding protein [Choiromyces venosus 120613-1]